MEALRWMLFDNHKFTSYLATYRFLKAFAQPAPDASVLAFLKGRFDAAAAIVDKHLAKSQIHGRRQADDGRLLAGRLRVLSGRGARLRLGQEPPQHPRLDRAAARAAGLEGPLRADAGRAHQAASGERALDPAAAAGDRRARSPWPPPSASAASSTRPFCRPWPRRLHLTKGEAGPDRLGQLPGLSRRRARRRHRRACPGGRAPGC